MRLQGQIDINKYVELDEIVVAGKTYNSSTQYLPSGSIWFTPQQDGYVKIALATLNSGQQGFSLYQINRNTDATNPYGTLYSGATEIETVYKDSDGKIYYNPSDTTNKTKIFDTTWRRELTKKGYIIMKFLLKQVLNMHLEIRLEMDHILFI